MQDVLYEITDAGKAALKAVGGVALPNEIRTKTVLPVSIRYQFLVLVAEANSVK
jgi:hypothetical protein